MMNTITSPYWNWLRTAKPITEKLRWCHTADAFILRNIISEGCITPRRCQIFNEDLIYFFYGRPAYRANGQEQVRVSAKAPVIIIFSNQIEANGVRLFPFDSGAFPHRYNVWMHDHMQLQSFQLPCGNEAPERHVSMFFGDRDTYLKMQPRKPANGYAGEFEVEALAELLCDKSSDRADDRRLTVELQINNNIPFSPPYVSALIVPETATDAPWFQKWRTLYSKEEENGMLVIKTYFLPPLRQRAEFQASLEDLCHGLV